MLSNTIDPSVLAAKYRAYTWNEKHALYGYPPDRYPAFQWILSLETRFSWLRLHPRKTSGQYLFREMIQWGGSQNGVLQKFDDGMDRICFSDLTRNVVTKLDDRRGAIAAALAIPGLGLTYASKLLRFFDPDNYGAFDSRVRKVLVGRGWKRSADPDTRVKIYDGTLNSMITGYCQYLDELQQLRANLLKESIVCPNSELNSTGNWRAADVEMALFQLGT